MPPMNSSLSKDEQSSRKQLPQQNQQANQTVTSTQLPNIQRDSVDISRMQPNQVLALQRSIGNRAVQQLVSSSRTAPVIQTKLQVGPVGDRYEQEADRIAAEVVKTPTTAPQMTQRETDPDAIQRDNLEEEDETM